MKTFLSAFLATVAISSYAATGDIKWLTIETNGSFAQICFEGYGNNAHFGRFNTVTVTNFTAATNYVSLTVTSPGYDTNGNLVSFQRQVITTRELRFKFGDGGQTTGFIPCVITNGSDVITRFALNEYIYVGDSNITAVAPANLFSNSLARSSFSVTNLSTNLYPKPVGQWTRPPFQPFTNGVVNLGFFAVGPGAGSIPGSTTNWGSSPYATNGHPVACLEFWATDEAGTHSPSNRVSLMTNRFDAFANNDRVPLPEYICNVDATGLQKTNKCRLNVRVKPWLGTNILDSSNTGYTYEQQQFELTWTYFFNDRANDFGGFVAVVDQVNGNNATARATNRYLFSTNAPLPPFKDDAGAFNAICRSNFIASGGARCDAAFSIIYHTNGNYRFSGGLDGTSIITTNTAPRTWLYYLPYPGTSREAVTITNAGGNKNLGDLLCVSNVTLSSVAAPTTFNSPCSNLWLAKVLIDNTTDTRCIDAVTNGFFTHCDVYDFPQGIGAGTTRKFDVRLIRGNYFSNSVAMTFQPTAVFGNLRDGWNGTNFNTVNGQSLLNSPFSYPVIAYNKFMAVKTASADIIGLFQTGEAQGVINTNGLALVMTLLEQVNSDPNAARCLKIASSAQSIPDTNDIKAGFLMHLTAAGQRENLFENAGGVATNAVPAVRCNIEMRNCSGDQPATKADRDYNQIGTNDGNWAFDFGVGNSGNTDLNPENMDTGWKSDFLGIFSFSRENIMPVNQAATYHQYYARFSSRVDSAGGVVRTYPGNGDYRMHNTTPFRNLANRWLLPYDINGAHITPANNAPGVYIFPPEVTFNPITPKVHFIGINKTTFLP